MSSERCLGIILTMKCAKNLVWQLEDHFYSTWVAVKIEKQIWLSSQCTVIDTILWYIYLSITDSRELEPIKLYIDYPTNEVSDSAWFSYLIKWLSWYQLKDIKSSVKTTLFDVGLMPKDQTWFSDICYYFMSN